MWAFGVRGVRDADRDIRRSVGTTIAETSAAILEREPDWERLPSPCRSAFDGCCAGAWSETSRRRLHHIADARIEIEDADRRSRREGRRAGWRRRAAAALACSACRPPLLALALVAMLAAWFLRRPLDAPELRVAEITTPRTSDPASFAMSPDGRRLAFVADHDGQPTLWVRELDSANARALPGTEGARRPFWSPDSRSIGFFMNSELKRIEARGGSPQTVTYLLAGTTAAWGPDGTILFSSTASPSLRRVNAAGGAVRGGDDASGGIDRPPTSAVPARRHGSSCSSSADRTPCAACTWARSDRRR